jgi:hypothetical protein
VTRRLSIFAVVFAASAAILSAAITRFDGALYTVSDNAITVKWNQPTTGSPPTRYEVRLRMTDLNTVYPVVNAGLQTQVTLQRPRAGHFVVEVRAVNSAGAGPWAVSSNSAFSKVNGTASAWMLYWKLPAPGGVIVD